MRVPDNTARPMPDVAGEAHGLAALAPGLDWVGMDEIHAPVSIEGPDGRIVTVPARASAYVNLTKREARGIHMSRLYLHVDRALTAEPLTACSLRHVVRDFVETHRDLSDAALLRVEFEYLIRRRALKSSNSGWKAYPIAITALLQRGQFALELAFELAYSSTCPASAALARQLIQERFAADFPAGAPFDRAAVFDWLGTAQGICATPHAQRSTAHVAVKLAPSLAGLPVVELIDRAEAALGTPVQTAVKREDEQAFAELNAANLMFCEDAARRLHDAFDADERVADFRIRATHHESLHAHDATAVVTKGVPGGYAA
jgi:GTP cyclohydrolase I